MRCTKVSVSHEATIYGRRVSTYVRPNRPCVHLQSSNQKPPTLFFPGAIFFPTVGGRPPKGPGTTCVLAAGTYDSPTPSGSPGSTIDPVARLVIGCEVDINIGCPARERTMTGGAAIGVCVASVPSSSRPPFFRIGIRWMKVDAGCRSS